FEDLHWSDRSSEEVMKSILESITGFRILLIFTYRPEYVHTWGTKSYHSQVTLNRLSNRESLNMTAHVLGTEDIDPALADLILEKTEGIPFVIEEFIKSLKDLRIIERKNNTYHLGKDIREVTIPSTIQDVIMARVDILPEAAKELLQTGSAIEREFSYELIKTVTGLSQDKLLSHLSVLKDSELLYERGIYPQSIYIFKHALTQEVVYNSILIRRKKKLHEMIGHAIEELYKDNINEHYSKLADHFMEGKNYEKGAEYSKLTVRNFGKAASRNEAIDYAYKRIDCIEKLPQTDNVQKQLIDARTNLGIIFTEINHVVESKDTVEPIFDLALKQNYKKRLSQINTILGQYYLFSEKSFPKAFEHLKEALRISEELKDVASKLLVNYWVGLANTFGKINFTDSECHLTISTDICIAANSSWGTASNKSTLAQTYFLNGKINSCLQVSGEAIELAEDSGDVFSKAVTNTMHGVCLYGKGFLVEAVTHLLKGTNLCDSMNILVWNGFGLTFLGEIYYEMEDYQQSMEYFSQAIKILEHNRLLPSYVNLCKTGITRANLMIGESDIQIESLFRYASKNNIKHIDGWISKIIGEILLKINGKSIPEAENWTKKAIEADKRNGMMWHLARDYALYADLFKRKGDLSKARENLVKGIEIFKECGADGWVKKYEEELAQM
ncbi:hypothetical protein LCGC14_2104150, partial [marine sediment metagenome]